MDRPRFTPFNCHSCYWYYHRDMTCNVSDRARETWSGGYCNGWEPCGEYLEHVEFYGLPPIPAEKPKQ